MKRFEDGTFGSFEEYGCLVIVIVLSDIYVILIIGSDYTYIRNQFFD